jgi:hypothetical protein
MRLVSYSQVIIYLFLIERVHIVRGSTKTRREDKLYWFNLCGLIPYCGIIILAITFRYNALGDDGHCFIGLRRQSSFPLLIYDLIINVPSFALYVNSDLSDEFILVPHTGIIFIQITTKSSSSTCYQAHSRSPCLISH